MVRKICGGQEMTIKKIGGTLAVVIATLTFSTATLAHECSIESEKIKMHASWLICARDGGSWEYDAIWQSGKASKKKNAVGDDNCDIQFKLAKQLYVPHDEPPKGRGNGNGNNTAQGAAGALDDHKFEDALLHLQNFVDTIDNAAKLNPDFEPIVKTLSDGTIVIKDAAWFADAFKRFAANMKLQIFNPDDGTGCAAGAF